MSCLDSYLRFISASNSLRRCLSARRALRKAFLALVSSRPFLGRVRSTWQRCVQVLPSESSFVTVSRAPLSSFPLSFPVLLPHCLLTDSPCPLATLLPSSLSFLRHSPSPPSFLTLLPHTHSPLCFLIKLSLSLSLCPASLCLPQGSASHLHARASELKEAALNEDIALGDEATRQLLVRKARLPTSKEYSAH